MSRIGASVRPLVAMILVNTVWASIHGNRPRHRRRPE